MCRTDCCFSPDDKLIVTGTSVQRGCGSGKLVFFERRTFQRVYEIHITDAVRIFCFLPGLENEVKFASDVCFVLFSIEHKFWLYSLMVGVFFFFSSP